MTLLATSDVVHDHAPAAPLVLFSLMPLVGGAFMIAIVVILVRAFTSGSRAAMPVSPSGAITLYGHLRRSDQVFSPAANWNGATYGTVALSGGMLLWAGDQGERWQVPVTQVGVVAAHGGASFTGPGLDLQIADTGHWRLTVSDRRINRFSRNTAKTFREGGTAQLFAQALLAQGAYDLRG